VYFIDDQFGIIRQLQQIM